LFLEHKFELHNEKKNKKPNVTKTLQPITLEVSSTSEEELSEEEVSEENEEESEKEDRQESSDNDEEYIEEEVVNEKNESIQHNDNIDLRTELKRRRALRLNMVIKK